MNSISLILTALLTGALIIIIGPNIIAFQRGKALRNIAIWLALFAALGLFYQTFGPGSAHPLFKQPDAFQGMKPMGTTNAPSDSHDYAPPKEE